MRQRFPCQCKGRFLPRLTSKVSLKHLRLYARKISQMTQFVYRKAPVGVGSDLKGHVKVGILFSSPRWNSVCSSYPLWIVCNVVVFSLQYLNLSKLDYVTCLSCDYAVLPIHH